MTRQSISIDSELIEILKQEAAKNSRSLSKEIAYRLKMSLRQEEEKDKKEGSQVS